MHDWPVASGTPGLDLSLRQNHADIACQHVERQLATQRPANKVQVLKSLDRPQAVADWLGKNTAFLGLVHQGGFSLRTLMVLPSGWV